MTTKAEIKENVGNNAAWAQRALVVLFARQTADEQRGEYTEHKNAQGFNAVDAEILSSFAKQVRNGRVLSAKQLAIAYRKLPKYAGQLLEIAQAKRGNNAD